MTPKLIGTTALLAVCLFAMLQRQPAFARTVVHAEKAVESGCTMSDGDRTWVEGAIKAWRSAEKNALQLSPSPLPTIMVADAHCAYVSDARQETQMVWHGTVHAETITLPDGTSAPFGVMSFAAPADTMSAGYFVMSLPSVWRAKGISSGLGLETLMDCVFIHEMSHTRQFYFANPALEELSRKYHLPDDNGDDSLQDAYKDNPAYVADYEAETNLLYAAAAAPDTADAKTLAKQALAKMRGRRAKWFTGDAEKWTPLDDIFLTMEGLGQWTAYAWLTSADGPHVDPAKALPEIRRKRNRWTQDEGLALFLVIDRLVPGWQKLAFGEKPELAEKLLERAAS